MSIYKLGFSKTLIIMITYTLTVLILVILCDIISQNNFFLCKMILLFRSVLNRTSCRLFTNLIEHFSEKPPQMSLLNYQLRFRIPTRNLEKKKFIVNIYNNEFCKKKKKIITIESSE